MDLNPYQSPELTEALPQKTWDWLALLKSNKDFLVCLIDQGVVSVAGFATTILIKRYSSESELGVYYIALAIFMFFRGIQQQMICVPYTIYQHQHADERSDQYRGSCLIQQFGLVALVLLFVAAQATCALNGLGEAETAPALFMLVALLPVLMMREIARNYCFAHLKKVSALVIDSSISALQIVGLFAVGYLGYMSGATAWTVIGLACLATLVVWYLKSGPKVEFVKPSISADWKLNWSFGKWAVAGQVIGSLPNFILPLVLTAYVSTAGTGYFAAAMALIGFANIFNVGMTNFLTPRAASVYADHGVSGLKKMFIKMAIVFIVALGSFIVLIALFGGWIAEAIFEISNLQTVMTVLAIAKLFEALVIVASVGLYVMEKIKANFYVDVCLMIFSLIAMACLIPTLRLEGAAWSLAAIAIFNAVLRGFVLRHFLIKQSKLEGAQ